MNKYVSGLLTVPFVYILYANSGAWLVSLSFYILGLLSFPFILWGWSYIEAYQIKPFSDWLDNVNDWLESRR